MPNWARILEIGTARLPSQRAGACSQRGYSIERLKGLHEKARSNLRPFRIPNIHLILGDGMQGYAAGALYR